MSLFAALQTNDTRTENGMPTNSTSLSNCVDLFFQIGAMRGKDKQTLINSFVKAYYEDALTAMRLLFWSRDVRGGAGERQIFRDIVAYLAASNTEVLSKNLTLFSEYGRWDDLLSLIGTPLETQALVVIEKGLADKNGLCAKWMPRPNIGNRERKRQANVIRKHLGLSPKEYRQLIVGLSKTVEQLMCSKNWTAIEYSKLPSKAMADYMKAFSKNDLARFQAYLASLEKGETKINAGAVYPYDIIKSLKHGGVVAGANEQWKALPNYLEGNEERLLPLVDVSGSMSQPVGSNPNLNVLDIAISLGLYISERNIGAFKDGFITFSQDPQLQILHGKLNERYSQLAHSSWGYNTNIEKAFQLILNKGKQGNIPQEQMPTMILILSDMQFDQACGNPSDNAQKMFEREYAAAGYQMPKIVYWNLAARGKNVPVAFDKQGTALVSGFSPAILTSLLAGKEMSPISMMKTVTESKRYAAISI
jgi:hypothetical protein